MFKDESATEGYFLIRDKRGSSTDFVLSVWQRGAAQHYIVKVSICYLLHVLDASCVWIAFCTKLLVLCCTLASGIGFRLWLRPETKNQRYAFRSSWFIRCLALDWTLQPHLSASLLYVLHPMQLPVPLLYCAELLLGTWSPCIFTR